MINIVVTSKPCDGLFYYSYEYMSILKSIGFAVKLIVISHRKFTEQDYIDSITEKYIHCDDIIFNDFDPDENDKTLILGRSMMTLGYQDFKDYSEQQQHTLKKVFKGNLIAVYSENHPTRYHQALSFFNPSRIIDLCDTEVYPDGPKDFHFEKIGIFDQDMRFCWSKNMEFGPKWVHMARYELILRLVRALWLRIILKPLLTPKRAME